MSERLDIAAAAAQHHADAGRHLERLGQLFAFLGRGVDMNADVAIRELLDGFLIDLAFAGHGLPAILARRHEHRPAGEPTPCLPLSETVIGRPARLHRFRRAAEVISATTSREVCMRGPPSSR